MRSSRQSHNSTRYRGLHKRSLCQNVTEAAIFAIRMPTIVPKECKGMLGKTLFIKHPLSNIVYKVPYSDCTYNLAFTENIDDIK